MDELERLIQSEKQAHELLSPLTSRIIEDLSILLQCFNQLDHYQPWDRALVLTHWEQLDGLKADFLKWAASRDRMIDVILSRMPGIDAAVALGEPSRGKFDYPIEKRRTRENVEALRNAEDNLDAFWVAIDRLLMTKAGNLSGTTIHALISQPRTLQRTPEWTETEKPLSVKPISKQNDSDSHSLYKPFSQLYFDIPTKQADIVQVKKKVKTRGKKQQKSAPVAKLEASEQPKPADPQPTFAVDARSLKVFRTMFFNPSTTSKPGEIQWTEFLHAMKSVGFGATKLYGSAWQFEPTKPGIERNIQFHEPHPQGRLAFLVARRFGRRLNRAYGWSGGTFFLAQKSTHT
ncbi:hypothetical protein N7528_007847 [Penicillium herquei]|nr:hypothetical protein N7528_007847 [Penicillium herquei]